MAFSIHFYEPGSYAVEGNGEYPSVISGQKFNKDELRKALSKRLKDSRNRPILVGEFSAQTKAGNYLEYDKDIIELFEEKNLNWIYWNYRNIKGKSETQALYYAKTSNNFVQFINEIKKGKDYRTPHRYCLWFCSRWHLDGWRPKFSYNKKT